MVLLACGVDRLRPATELPPAEPPPAEVRCAQAEGPCREVVLEASECVEQLVPDGAACETACTVGTCLRGTCEGALRSCPVANACAVPVCDPLTGCGQVPRACTTTNPCQTAWCDAVLGCQTRDLADGTACGVDDCRASTVSVCLQGQCVARARPTVNQCSGRWIDAHLHARSNPALAWDGARGVMVLFGGGGFADTWERDSSGWRQRFPEVSPPAVLEATMAWDALRRRSVLVTNEGATWEWDGTTWTSFRTPPRRGQVAYDGTLAAVVLFDGSSLWQWSGSTWEGLRSPHPRPRFDGALAWDPDRRRLLLFGGRTDGTAHSELADLWAWDARTLTWTEVVPEGSVRPSGMWGASMAWDDARRALVVNAGWTRGGAVGAGIWEFTGNQWRLASERTASIRGAVAFDRSRQLVVRVGSDGTREWTGRMWRSVDALAPVVTPGSAVVADTGRKRVVVLLASTSETWEWDGATWTRAHPSSAPSPRRDALVAYDSRRRRVVLVGGVRESQNASALNDTWEWDGVTWQERPPGAPTGGAAMTFDSSRERTVLVTSDATWEWDGTSWLRSASIPPPGRPVLFAWDPVERGVRSVVLSGVSPHVRSSVLVGDAWVEDVNPLPLSRLHPLHTLGEVDRVSGESVFVTSSSGVFPGVTLRWGAGVVTEAAASPRSLWATTLVWDPSVERLMSLSYEGMAHFAR